MQNTAYHSTCEFRRFIRLVLEIGERVREVPCPWRTLLATVKKATVMSTFLKPSKKLFNAPLNCSLLTVAWSLDTLSANADASHFGLWGLDLQARLHRKPSSLARCFAEISRDVLPSKCGIRKLKIHEDVMKFMSWAWALEGLTARGKQASSSLSSKNGFSSKTIGHNMLPWRFGARTGKFRLQYRTAQSGPFSLPTKSYLRSCGAIM